MLLGVAAVVVRVAAVVVRVPAVVVRVPAVLVRVPAVLVRVPAVLVRVPAVLARAVPLVVVAVLRRTARAASPSVGCLWRRIRRDLPDGGWLDQCGEHRAGIRHMPTGPVRSPATVRTSAPRSTRCRSRRRSPHTEHDMSPPTHGRRLTRRYRATVRCGHMLPWPSRPSPHLRDSRESPVVIHDSNQLRCPSLQALVASIVTAVVSIQFDVGAGDTEGTGILAVRTHLTSLADALVSASVVLTAAIICAGAAARRPSQEDQFVALLAQLQIPAHRQRARTRLPEPIKSVANSIAAPRSRP